MSYVGVEREDAEYTNIQGAVEIVELARNCEHLRCLVHHSTAHTSGSRTGTVFESELDEGQSFQSVVQETRMKAELVMRRAMADVPIAVVRPTMLVGDSVTGEADLRQVVTAVTNAEVTLQTAIAIRDRVIEAYQDIMRMSI